MTHTNKLLIFLLLIIFAVGCQDGCNCSCGGCTTRKIVDNERETRRIDGVKVRITANKVRSTNRKLNLRGGSNLINKSVWYSVNYNLEIADRPELKEICEYYVEENHDLEVSLKEFSMKFSPDKSHFGVGRTGNVWDFFHFLDKGNAFPSGTFYFVKTKTDYSVNSNLTFDKIDWNIFPEHDILFDTLIIQYGNSNQKYTVYSTQPFLNLLAGMKPGNAHELFLINNWYNEIGALHFTQERVAEIVKVSPQWKSTAISQIFEEIEDLNSFDLSTFSPSLNLLISINDEKSLHNADDLLFKNEKYDNSDTRDYFIKRFDNKTIPLKDAIRNDLISTAKSTVQMFPEFSDMLLGNAVDILLSIKDEKTLTDFIKKINIKQNPDEIGSAFYVSDIINQTIEKYDVYPKTLQKLIISEFKNYINNADIEISQFDVQKIYEFLKDKISCEEATKIYKKFESKLQFSKKPC